MAGFSETTLQSEFYSPWPKFGKRFSLQLNESRANAEALHPIVRAAGLDSAYTSIRNAAVAALEVGEQDFHNKYRIFWDKVRTTFRLQQNTGTSVVPIWTDRFTIGSSGELVGNFYPSGSSVAVKTTSGLPPIFNNVDTLLFNRESFYLSTSSAGKPIVNFSGTASGGGGGVTDHGALTGLLDDDHTQYLLVNGTRAMTGDLDMGGKDLLNTYSGVFNDKVSAEAFYLRKGGEVKAYTFNNSEFYISGGTNGHPVVNLMVDPSTIQLTTTKTTGISNPTVYTTPKITFNRDDFYVTKTKVTKELLVSVARGVGSVIGGTSIVVKDGIPPNFNTDTITFSKNEFYLSKDSVGKPIVNLVTVGGGTAGISSITVKEKTSPDFSTDTLSFNSNNFYLTKDSIGKPMVNLVTMGINIKEKTSPAYLNSDTLSFNSSNFYLTSDRAGKPMVNLVVNDTTYKDGNGPSITSDTLTFNKSNFYLSKDSYGKALINLVSDGVTVTDSAHPVYPNISKLTFNSAYFYLTKDSSSKPIVNLTSKPYYCLVKQTVDQPIANNTNVTAAWDQTVTNQGGWTVNLAAGTIQVPAGVKFVNVIGQIRMNTFPADGRMNLNIRLNGANVSPIISTSQSFLSSSAVPSQNVVSYPIPVSTGDTISLVIVQVMTAPASVNTLGSGDACWLSVEGTPG